MYQYRECGLERVWLVNGYVKSQDRDGEELIAIEDVHGLHRAIGEAIIGKPGELTGPEFRFLRKELDVSQKMLGTLLGYSDGQMIAQWEKGKVPVLRLADAVIRRLYVESISGDGSPIKAILTLISDVDRTIIERDYKFNCNRAEGSWRPEELTA